MTDLSTPSRRRFLSGGGSLLALVAAGCATAPRRAPVAPPPEPPVDASLRLMYGPMPNERFPLPAIPIEKIPRQFIRQRVPYQTPERVGTIVVDTQNFFLYLVEENGMAMRYGVGLGRAGFAWSGRARVGWKQEWPKWTPPDEMIARQPELEKWSAENGGMPPGLGNPLGARALYIFQGNVDTLYRIHGSPEYWSIGKAVSSGCVRMINQDVIDLYGRVPKNSPIVVL